MREIRLSGSGEGAVLSRPYLIRAPCSISDPSIKTTQSLCPSLSPLRPPVSSMAFEVQNPREKTTFSQIVLQIFTDLDDCAKRHHCGSTLQPPRLRSVGARALLYRCESVLLFCGILFYCEDFQPRREAKTQTSSDLIVEALVPRASRQAVATTASTTNDTKDPAAIAAFGSLICVHL